MPSMCAYHPTEPAVATCENCGKHVCVACNLVYRQRYSRGYYSYSESFRYCPECKYGRESYKGPVSTVITIFLLAFCVITGIVAIIVGMIVTSLSGVFGNIPIIIFGVFMAFFFSTQIIIMVAVFVGMKRRGATAQHKLEEFRASIALQNNSPYTPPVFQYHKQRMFCNQCGVELSPDQKFCPSCGDSTADEHRMHPPE